MGLNHEVRPSNVEETNDLDLAPAELAARWAREKALAVAWAGEPESWYLGVDTIVVVGNEVLGKPGSRAEARTFLDKLAGRWHEVISAYCIVHPVSDFRLERAVSSRVRIKALTAEEREAYLDTEEPYDKAGAYAVQGIGAFMVEAIEGSYTNVVGLPLTEVVDDLRAAGVIAVPAR
jgi:septum formation protein